MPLRLRILCVYTSLSLVEADYSDSASERVTVDALTEGSLTTLP